MGVGAAAGIAGAAGLAGAGLSFMGASSQAKAQRQAMEKYLAYINGQRQEFLNQPQSTAIKDKLTSYIGGDVGYSPDVMSQMKQGVYEDYGKALGDAHAGSAGAGLTPGGAYSPGRADRATRRLTENIASNRAQSIRDINVKNADVALNNQRFAVSALPTFMPGTPSTQTVGPDVFQGMNTTVSPGQFFGPALQQAGQQTASFMMPGIQAQAYAPIMQQMMQYMRGPQAAAMEGGGGSPGPWSSGYRY